MTEILVLCPFGIEKGLVSEGAKMGTVRVLVPEKDREEALLYGAKYVHLLKGEIIDEGDFAAFLAEWITKLGSGIILAPATVQMRNVMPYLASLIKAGLTADCTALDFKDGLLLQTRPAFGNSLMATIRALSSIQMATVRPGTFLPEKRPCLDGEIFEEIYIPKQDRIKRGEFIPFSQKKPLTEAKIIVAGGAGIGSTEGFMKLSRFAEKIGAALGASRTAVDNGFLPYHCQVGMTGITVCPKLYVAVGISGAVQHLAGMAGSEKVIAINSDPKAPIFDYADYGFVGDWKKIIPN